MKPLYEYHPISTERIDAMIKECNVNNIMFAQYAWSVRTKDEVIEIKLLTEGEINTTKKSNQKSNIC